MKPRKLSGCTPACLCLQMWRSQTQSPSAAVLTLSWSPARKRNSPLQRQHQLLTACRLPWLLTRATRSSAPHESYLALTLSSSRPRVSLDPAVMARLRRSSHWHLTRLKAFCILLNAQSRQHKMPLLSLRCAKLRIARAQKFCHRLLSTWLQWMSTLQWLAQWWRTPCLQWVVWVANDATLR